jgi:hypothetical protein
MTPFKRIMLERGRFTGYAESMKILRAGVQERIGV